MPSALVPAPRQTPVHPATPLRRHQPKITATPLIPTPNTQEHILIPVTIRVELLLLASCRHVRNMDELLELRERIPLRRGDEQNRGDLHRKREFSHVQTMVR